MSRLNFQNWLRLTGLTLVLGYVTLSTLGCKFGDGLEAQFMKSTFRVPRSLMYPREIALIFETLKQLAQYALLGLVVPYFTAISGIYLTLLELPTLITGWEFLLEHRTKFLRILFSKDSLKSWISLEDPHKWQFAVLFLTLLVLTHSITRIITSTESMVESTPATNPEAKNTTGDSSEDSSSNDSGS